MPDLGKKSLRIEVPGLDVDIYRYITKPLDRTWSVKSLSRQYRAQPSRSTASLSRGVGGYRTMSDSAFVSDVPGVCCCRP